MLRTTQRVLLGNVHRWSGCLGAHELRPCILYHVHEEVELNSEEASGLHEGAHLWLGHHVPIVSCYCINSALRGGLVLRKAASDVRESPLK
jgi:hypothetical protein